MYVQVSYTCTGTQWHCICSAQFANLRNFKIALHKLEIAKLQTNFDIVQPSLRNFEIVHPSLRNFEIALHKLEIAKLRSTLSKVDVYSNIKRTCTFLYIQKLPCRILNPKYESVTLNMNSVNYFRVNGQGCLMRRPFVPSGPGLWEFAFKVRDPTSKFWGLGKGTDLLYTVIHSSYTWP